MSQRQPRRRLFQGTLAKRGLGQRMGADHEVLRGAGRDHGLQPVSDVLVREQRSGVLVVRLNRPEARNALNGTLIRAISAAIVDAELDPDIRALVITGTGDRAFCAGMDLRDFASSGQGSGSEPGAMDGYRR